MIEVDGSMLEGGGQLLRISTTYSAILGEPIRIFDIRANRDPPGLRPQHLTTLQALEEICGAETNGLEIGSREILFKPGRLRGGDYNFDIGTAGSISLLLQCIAPAAAFAPSKLHLKIKGGTAVRWSPPIPIVENVVWRAFNLMGFNGQLDTLREGYFPKGGGLVEAIICPISGFKSVILEETNIERIEGVSTCGKLPIHIAERQARSAKKSLNEAGYIAKIDIKSYPPKAESSSPGSVICLWTIGEALMGSDVLGVKGKTAESVGQEVASSLINQLKVKASVDLHTADNLILPCSLAEGKSVFIVSNITSHTITAIRLAEQITGAKFYVKEKEGGSGHITCYGIGLKNRLIKL